MDVKYILYLLLILTCIQLSLVIAALQGSKQTLGLVANGHGDERPQTHHKLKGRHRPHIETLKGNSDENRRSKNDASDGQKKSVDKQTPAPKSTVVPELPADSGNNTKGGTGNGRGGTYDLPALKNMVDTKTGFYILIGVTLFIIGCFVIKMVRSKSRRKTKKYGIVATRGSEVELTPLDQEEEDEDMTVFDANSK